MNNIQKQLNILRKCQREYEKPNSDYAAISKRKGTAGELAVLYALEEYKQKHKISLFQSYSYVLPLDPNGNKIPTNMFLINSDNVRSNPDAYNQLDSDGKIAIRVDTNAGEIDEIDIIAITQFRIFLIEVKSYKNKLELFDYWEKYNSSYDTKGILGQTEKHARCFYNLIYQYLPNGNPNYIIPIVCIPDIGKIIDNRSADYRKKYPVVILNELVKSIHKRNTVLHARLNTEEIIKYMRSKASKIEMCKI